MKNISKDTKMLIAIVVLVLFAGYYFLLRPQGGALAERRATREEIEQSVTDAELVLRGAAVQPDVPSPGADTDLDAAVPARAEVPSILRSLQAIAAATGMVHGSIAPSPIGANPAGPGGSIVISISATGTREAALAYVQQLSSLPRLVLIEQVALLGGTDGSETQLQLTVQVFTRVAPAAAA